MAKVDIRKHKRLLRQDKQMLEEYASHGFEASEYESKKDWNDDVGIYRKKIEKLEQIASIIDKNKDLDSKEVERARKRALYDLFMSENKSTITRLKFSKIRFGESTVTVDITFDVCEVPYSREYYKDVVFNRGCRSGQYELKNIKKYHYKTRTLRTCKF